MVRTRPDIAGSMSAAEIVRRWNRIFPKRRDAEANLLPVADDVVRGLDEPGEQWLVWRWDCFQ